MASARRAARAGLDRQQGAECEAPAWLWRFRSYDWGIPWPPSDANPVELRELVRARRQWRETREAWLAERDLVMYGMHGLSLRDFQRIEHEEPHRVLRRPGA
ncbi:hypothetical protein [Streptomyces sp. NPDC048665]|uniref:hypothetical protein n=1 Tax=Streptomyces sp. NPDC048665 TaxID=3155490 RepID=UPI00342B3943